MTDATHTRESEFKPKMEFFLKAIMECAEDNMPDQCYVIAKEALAKLESISTPIPLTPSDEMVAAAMVQALKQHAASDGPSDGDDEKIWLEGYFDIRAILQAALNLMGGKK